MKETDHVMACLLLAWIDYEETLGVDPGNANTCAEYTAVGLKGCTALDDEFEVCPIKGFCWKKGCDRRPNRWRSYKYHADRVREMNEKEAKERCIRLWEYLAEHIMDEVWRNDVLDMVYFYKNGGVIRSRSDKFKRQAIMDCYDDRPRNDCYLCEVFQNWEGRCGNCVLRNGEDVGCVTLGEPYFEFSINACVQNYPQAAHAARQLIERVVEWEVE